LGVVHWGGGFGHSFLAWLDHGRWIVIDVQIFILFIVLFILHWISPEQKLAGGEAGFMFVAGRWFLE